jgi:hypothetical protein
MAKYTARKSFVLVCNDDIGSEVHYLFICKSQYLSNLREKIIPPYYTTYPNDHKLAVLFRGGSRISSYGSLHLKKLRRAEGGAKIFGVFRVKNHDFTPKKNLFFLILGGGAPGAPLTLDPPLLLSFCNVQLYIKVI